MEKQLIKRINGIEIFAVTDEEANVLVPIKTICKAIGVDFAGQFRRIQEDEILAPTIDLRSTVGGDGKDREMVCLPLRYVYGWLFSINPKNVASEAKEVVIKYKLECYDALYNHFEGQRRKTIEAREAEIKLLRRRSQIEDQEKELKYEKKEIDKNLEKLQQERLNPQPSLFD